MKTAIKLALIYFGFQIAGMVLGSFFGIIYSLCKTGTIDGIESSTLSLSLLFSMIFMGIYLWKAKYISKEKTTWSPVSGIYLLLTVAICFASIVVLDYILSFMDWLPNILETTFSTLQAGWLGIFCIAILGPILEELLFRGAITKALLQEYNPTKAIVISALVFGIIHINPIQVVSATLIGFLLAWVYYKTASLIPCIIIHIINNTLSVYLSLQYSEVETIRELFTGSTYYIIIGGAIVIFLLCLYLMDKTTVNYPWNKKDQI